MAFDESASRLGSYASQQGYTWVFGAGPGSLTRDFNVNRQSSYVGIGRDGVIVSTSRNSGKNWTNILNDLQASS